MQRISRLPKFNGIIYDVGGPTANMYGAQCTKGGNPCSAGNCLIPEPCERLRFGHDRQIALLNKLMAVPGIKKVFISSGIRHDLVMADKKYGKPYVEQLVNHHVSGQIKLAPEHCDNEVLALMNKPSIKTPDAVQGTLREHLQGNKGKVLHDLLPHGGTPRLHP